FGSFAVMTDIENVTSIVFAAVDVMFVMIAGARSFGSDGSYAARFRTLVFLIVRNRIGVTPLKMLSAFSTQPSAKQRSTAVEKCSDQLTARSAEGSSLGPTLAHAASDCPSIPSGICASTGPPNAIVMLTGRLHGPTSPFVFTQRAKYVAV